MIMRSDIEPIQLGAFLCLMRVMGETSAELAGLVMAARETLHRPSGAPTADLDWPAYAGKKNRLPWFLLTALLLAGAGIRVAMHGRRGTHGGAAVHRAGRARVRHRAGGIDGRSGDATRLALLHLCAAFRDQRAPGASIA